MNKTHKLTFKIVRSFGFGFEIFSPKLNGLYFQITIACLKIDVWNRGKGVIRFASFWDIPDWQR